MNKNCTTVLQKVSSVQKVPLTLSHRYALRKISTGHCVRSTNQHRSGALRHMSHSSRRENNQQPKSLNWLVRPDREKSEPKASTIEFGGADKSVVGSAVAKKLTTPEQSDFKNGTFYHEKIVLGYSAEQMCDLVGNVQKYKEFLPFCINSELVYDDSL